MIRLCIITLCLPCPSTSPATAIGPHYSIISVNKTRQVHNGPHARQPKVEKSKPNEPQIVNKISSDFLINSFGFHNIFFYLFFLFLWTRILENKTFITCKWGKLCKHYVNSWVIAFGDICDWCSFAAIINIFFILFYFFFYHNICTLSAIS